MTIKFTRVTHKAEDDILMKHFARWFDATFGYSWHLLAEENWSAYRACYEIYVNQHANTILTQPCIGE